GRPAKPELDLFELRRLDVDMIVSVISDEVSRLADFLEPIYVFLFEYPADNEAMHRPAVGLDAPASFRRVFFGLGVQVAFLVIPVGVFPTGKVATHFQIEGDGDESLF